MLLAFIKLKFDNSNPAMSRCSGSASSPSVTYKIHGNLKRPMNANTAHPPVTCKSEFNDTWDARSYRQMAE